MIGIVDYGAGNVGNLARALRHLGWDPRLLPHPEGARGVNLLILPGVGAFPSAWRRLVESGWAQTLREAPRRGQPLLGICLGMQLLAKDSSEEGLTPGLGLVEGSVRPLKGLSRIPHMGWNVVDWREGEALASGVPSWFYFVHSFALEESPDAVATCTVEGRRFVAAVRRGPVAGCQFHPERSGPEGVAFLGHLIAMMTYGGPR